MGATWSYPDTVSFCGRGIGAQHAVAGVTTALYLLRQPAAPPPEGLALRQVRFEGCESEGTVESQVSEREEQDVSRVSLTAAQARGLQLEPRAATVTAGWPARTTPALSPLRYRIVKVGRDEVLGPDFTQ